MKINMNQVKLVLRHYGDMLSGRDVVLPQKGFFAYRSLIWPVWWAILLGFIAIFSGQSSKFIYIDF